MTSEERMEFARQVRVLADTIRWVIPAAVTEGVQKNPAGPGYVRPTYGLSARDRAAEREAVSEGLEHLAQVVDACLRRVTKDRKSVV